MSNTENLTSDKALKKLNELVDDIKMCLFCTNLKIDDGATCRPMSTARVDDNGDIWFISGKSSDKNREIKQDNKVRLYYSHPGKSSYLVVNGEARISTDRKMIDELWSPLDKTWFKEGKDDPEVSLICVSNISAYYWDTKGNQMVNFLKMVASAATGKNLVEGHQGDLSISGH